MKHLFFYLACAALSLHALAQTPDYHLKESWAFLSENTVDCPAGMLMPEGYREPLKSQVSTPPDVFYIYPTFYKDLPVKSWNADLSNEIVRKDVRELALPHQASVFCGVSRLFVPYYRQMHIEGYRNAHLPEVGQAYDTAYSDVLRAFETYLQRYYRGGDIVVAGHSQGTNHAERLIKERILPDSSLRDKLVLAYLIGMPVKENFENFPLCREPGETHCFLSWRSYGKDFVPPIHGDSIAVINPLTFSSSQERNDPEIHRGVLMPKHKFRFPGSVIVNTMDGYLRVEQLKIPLGKRFQWEDYHKADYNLYWGNIRQNFAYRINLHHERVEKGMAD